MRTDHVRNFLQISFFACRTSARRSASSSLWEAFYYGWSTTLDTTTRIDSFLLCHCNSSSSSAKPLKIFWGFPSLYRRRRHRSTSDFFLLLLQELFVDTSLGTCTVPTCILHFLAMIDLIPIVNPKLMLDPIPLVVPYTHGGPHSNGGPHTHGALFSYGVPHSELSVDFVLRIAIFILH